MAASAADVAATAAATADRAVAGATQAVRTGTVVAPVAVARGRSALGVALAGLAGFGAIFASVRAHRSEALDLALMLRLQRERRPWLDRVMAVVSWPGFPPQSRIIPPAAIGAMWLVRFRAEAAFQAAAWGTAALSTTLKALMDRPRPVAGTDLRVVVAPLGGSSFPSGHVITYLGTYGFLAYLAHTLIPSTSDVRAPDRQGPDPAAGDASRPAGTTGIRVIWNLRAGTKAGIPTNHGTEAEIRAVLARAGLSVDIVPMETPEAARAEAESSVRRHDDLLVVAGGDGSFATVAEALLGSTTALGFLPLGSVMNVARSLGIPRDLDEAAAVIAGGRVRAIDVGEAAGRPFFEAASVGLNAAMFGEAQRFESGDWSSIARTVWVALRYRPARMTIELEDGPIQTSALMVTVANGPYTGAGMTVAPDARLDDGRFDVRVFRRFSKPRLLRHLVSIAFGRYRYAPEVDTYRAGFVRISGASALPARADARDLGTTPIELVTRPRALRVVVSAEWARASDPAQLSPASGAP